MKMRGKLSLLVYFVICLFSLLAIPILVTVSLAKQKCQWVCLTVPSDFCPGPCFWLPSQKPTVADECIHYLPPSRDTAGNHTIKNKSGDIYRRQCVPCDAPEGATEPQFMQWAEITDYWCGVTCFGWFVTTKGEGPQNPVTVPCWSEVE